MLCSAFSVDQEGFCTPNTSAARRGRETTTATAHDSAVDEREQGCPRWGESTSPTSPELLTAENLRCCTKLCRAPSETVEGSPELPLFTFATAGNRKRVDEAAALG
nr:hypothetical protein Itr_chr13CG15330 [Ipomoea trifida]